MLTRADVQAMIDQSVAKAYVNIARLTGSLTNRAFCVEQATTNAQGHTGAGGVIANASLTSKTSGLFMWSASVNFGATAADAVTISTLVESGVGAVTVTGGGAAGTGCLVDTAATGTYLVVTGGGGVGQFTAHSLVETVGTAGAGLLYTASGIVGADANNTPITVGHNIILSLKIVDATSDGTCHGITLSLMELP